MLNYYERNLRESRGARDEQVELAEVGVSRQSAKFTIVSKSKLSKINQILNDLKTGLDIKIDNNNPDFVITYGGDGTIIDAERLFPGIPKITIRESDGGFKCLYKESDLKNVIIRILDGRYKLKEELKLEMEFEGKKYQSLNEIQLHNINPTQAVRFSVFVNDKSIYWNVIGDGVIIATPFGSTAYFTSVGGIRFSKGIGIALNNPFRFECEECLCFSPCRFWTEPYRFSVFDSDSCINIKVNRDEGILLFDNSPIFITVKEGDDIIIKKSNTTAKFVVI